MSEEEALKTIEELKNYISLEMIDINKSKELTDLFAKSIVAFQVMENAYNKEKLNSFNLSEQLNKEKEIEELKEDNKHQWEERCKLTFKLENSTSNDKIKAKIEEYRHKDFIKMQVVMKHDKEALKIVDVLQSLLEKE